MNVGDMHFDDGCCHSEERIEDCDRCCRKSCRIDDEPDGLLGARLLNPTNDLALVIGWPEYQSKSVPFRRCTTELLDVAKRGAAIKLRLARAKQIEIRSVEDVDGLWHFRRVHPAVVAAGGHP